MFTKAKVFVAPVLLPTRQPVLGCAPHRFSQPGYESDYDGYTDPPVPAVQTSAVAYR